MRLYYTVASQPEAVQDSINLSLGGFKSSSEVINTQMNNLFGDITPTTVSNFNQNRYIGLVLKNETGVNVTEVKLWFDYPTGCYTKFRVAAVDMVANSNGDLQMEHIYNPNSKPLSGDFYEADGELNAVNLGNLLNAEQIGIWIERELLLDIIQQSEGDVYEVDPALEGRYKAKELPKIDDIGVILSWTVI